jgi:hypothetical protein
MRDAVALMTEAAEELDAYYAQEHAGDHPHSVTKLAQAKEANPARVTALQEQPAPCAYEELNDLCEELGCPAGTNRVRFLRELLSALQPSPAREEAEALVKRLRDPQFGTETTERNLMTSAAAFIARHHLGEKS